MSLRWIELDAPGRLTVRPRPRAEDLAAWTAAGADLVVSLLEPHEEDAAATAGTALSIRRFPIEDFGVPADEAAFERLVRELDAALEQGSSIVAHCLGGRGRSSLLAASLLALRGLPMDEALARIRAARGTGGPETLTQGAWLDRFTTRLRNR